MVDLCPRVYALDMIVPNQRMGDGDIVVIDLNGSRSGCVAQRSLYGDDRVQDGILEILAQAGRGIIQSITQVSSAPQQVLLESARARTRTNGLIHCGCYNAVNAYIPLGDPFCREQEKYTAECAKRLGIEYREALVTWDTSIKEFWVEERKGKSLLRDWSPEGIIWPYSWDQRNFPLPPNCLTCNPPHYSLSTTNKLLCAILASRGGMGNRVPAYAPGGFWLKSSPRLTEAISIVARGPLSIIKPLSSFRGFGTLIVPTHALLDLLPTIGFTANQEQLDFGANLLMLAMLWGEGHELLGLLQAYVEPRVSLHQETGRPHVSIVRATVVVGPDTEDRSPRCVDACQILASVPRDGQIRRDALIISGGRSANCLRLSDKDREAVSSIAENFVETIERMARLSLPEGSLSALSCAESQLMIDALDKSSDIPACQLWEDYKKHINLAELMGALVSYGSRA